MPSYESILARVICLGSRRIPDRPLRDTTAYLADLLLDSITALELVTEIEDEFGIVIPLRELPNLRTLGDTARRLQQVMGDR